MSRADDGDEYAKEFEDLIEGLLGPLERWAYFCCQDKSLADDLVMETLIRLRDRWPSLRSKLEDPEKYAMYARRIVRNLFNDELRRRQKDRKTSQQLGVFHGSSRDPAEIVVWADTIRNAMRKLSPREREIVFLRGYEGYGVSDIAIELGITPGVVSNYLTKARKRLEKYIEDPEG